MKIRYVSIETVFPVAEADANNDARAVVHARHLLMQRLKNNPSSIMFSVETQETPQEDPIDWEDAAKHHEAV